MKLLIELLTILEAKKTKVAPSTRRKVYHADYLKTKNKPYRKHAAQARRHKD